MKTPSVEKKIIMFDSPEAAEKIIMELWKSSDGRLAVTEETARYNGCTHKVCECGGVMKKNYTVCKECGSRLRHERYRSLPFREWDRKEPVCTADGDEYFFDEDELVCYMEENEMNGIELLICSKNTWQTVDEDYWGDMMPEDSDGELPKKMQTALDALNTVIRTLPPQSYSPSKIRTSYKV